jgi:hypothetical protein
VEELDRALCGPGNIGRAAARAPRPLAPAGASGIL